MKSLLNKLILVCVALAGWVVYDRWDQITGSVEQAKHAVSGAMQSEDSARPVTTTVYKWQDADGNWQLSNTRPDDVANVQIQQYRSDTNVMPAVKAPAKSAGTKKSNNAKEEMSSLPGAGLVQSAAKTFGQVQDLKESLETPKTVPTD